MVHSQLVSVDKTSLTYLWRCRHLSNVE